MAFVYYNPNPSGKRVGDCVIRGIAKVTGQDWEQVYIDVCAQGFKCHDMPAANTVWGEYLKRQGFIRKILPDICPNCYTVKDFCENSPKGTYLLATGTHVVAVIDGDYYDAWDSGNEIPVYYFVKGE